MIQTEASLSSQKDTILFFLAEAIFVLFLTFVVVTFTRNIIIHKVLSQVSALWPKETKHHVDTFITSIATVEVKPFRLPQLKRGASSKMTMGLKRLDQPNWLTIDEHYLAEHLIRCLNLDDRTPDVLQHLPGSEAACLEVLDLVSSFLSTRYPDSFVISSKGNDKNITNNLTGETFPLANNKAPLETAARLAMEDFNILIRDEEGQYRLQASATLFPAGWRLEDRIGGTMSDLHGPVPKWKENLGASVNRYFDRISPTTAMERHPLFVQTVPELFQSTSLASAASPAIITPSDIHVRRERQTFRRLPISGAVLFTVRTYITPLTMLCDDEVAALLEIATSWSDDMATYKGRETWYDVLTTYALEKGVGNCEA